MYYRLKNIKLINNNQKADRFNILSEVIDSPLSFEKPVIVDSVEELDLWFGKSFDEYTYLCGLLESGVSLYLYRPIQTPSSNFLSNFTEVSTIKVELPLVSLPEKGETGAVYILRSGSMYFWNGLRWIQTASDSEYKYKKGDEEKSITFTKRIEYYSTESEEKINSIDQIEESTHQYERIRKIYVLSDGTKYIWYEWFRLEDLKLFPDFNEEDYELVTGLKTLPKITEDTREDIEKHIYKIGGTKYVLYGDSTWMNVDYLPQVLENTSSSLENRDTVFIATKDSKVQFSHPKYKNRQLVFSSAPISNIVVNASDADSIISGRGAFAFDIVFPSKPKVNDFIVLPDTNSNLWLLKYKGTIINRKKIKETYIPDSRILEFTKKSEFFKLLQNSLGYTVSGKTIISPKLVKYIDFNYEFGISINFDISFECINSTLENTEKGIEVWSRCIGKDSDQYDDSQYIKFTLEEGTLDGYYRAIIEKYGYSEVFEAPIYPEELGESTLENEINTGSRLVRCRIGSDNINLGTYTLRGGYVESFNTNSYISSLTEMFEESNSTVYPDFLLIPDIKKFDIEESTSGNYKIYETLLDLAKEYRFQVLIQNDSEEEAKHNLVESDNFLVYFYSNIQTYYGYDFPGYYIFLNEIFSGEYNKVVTEEIFYPNVSEDPYENSTLEETLTKFKSNYLSYNNHIYYYKKYLNGENYSTSILRRFLIGKIYRELMKLSRSLFAERNSYKIKTEIYEVLNTIAASYSNAVSGIEITEFNLDLQNNKLILKIESSLKDLIEEDILLDITINYNENGNSITAS